MQNNAEPLGLLSIGVDIQAEWVLVAPLNFPPCLYSCAVKDQFESD
jgi:hypothetical protein